MNIFNAMTPSESLDIEVQNITTSGVQASDAAAKGVPFKSYLSDQEKVIEQETNGKFALANESDSAREGALGISLDTTEVLPATELVIQELPIDSEVNVNPILSFNLSPFQTRLEGDLNVEAQIAPLSAALNLDPETSLANAGASGTMGLAQTLTPEQSQALRSPQVANQGSAQFSTIPMISTAGTATDPQGQPLQTPTQALLGAESNGVISTTMLQGQVKQNLNQSASGELNVGVDFSNALDLELGNTTKDGQNLKSIAMTFGAAEGASTSTNFNSLTPARLQATVPFGRAEWAMDIAAQVSKVAAQNLNFAEIQLDPPELGSLQVRVQVNNDQATVSFTAQNAQVREALEQHGNRLRELFNAEGMNLVDVDVSDQGQQKPEHELDSKTAGTQTDAELEDSDVDLQTVSARVQVGVDDYV